MASQVLDVESQEGVGPDAAAGGNASNMGNFDEEVATGFLMELRDMGKVMSSWSGEGLASKYARGMIDDIERAQIESLSLLGILDEVYSGVVSVSLVHPPSF